MFVIYLVYIKQHVMHLSTGNVFCNVTRMDCNEFIYPKSLKTLLPKM